RSESVTPSIATPRAYRFPTPSIATRSFRACAGATLLEAARAGMEVAEAPEHVLRRFRSQRDHARAGRERPPELGEGKPDGRGPRVAEMVCVDEHAPRLDAEVRPQQLRQVPVRLVWDHVVDDIDAGPEIARDRGRVIEQRGPAKAHRREVVIELEDPVLGEGCVRAARGEGKAGCPADANLAEEVVAEPRARAGIVGAKD